MDNRIRLQRHGLVFRIVAAQLVVGTVIVLAAFFSRDNRNVYSIKVDKVRYFLVMYLLIVWLPTFC